MLKVSAFGGQRKQSLWAAALISTSPDRASCVSRFKAGSDIFVIARVSSAPSFVAWSWSLDSIYCSIWCLNIWNGQWTIWIKEDIPAYRHSLCTPEPMKVTLIQQKISLLTIKKVLVLFTCKTSGRIYHILNINTITVESQLLKGRPTLCGKCESFVGPT